MQGSDLIGGKSLCYQIPPLVHNTMCVVVSPLIALMQDQSWIQIIPLSVVRELKHQNIPCALLSSAQSTTEYRSVLASLSKPNCKYNLLYVTPERLQIAEFLSILQSIHKRGNLSLIAIDEAHCISTYVLSPFMSIVGAMTSVQLIEGYRVFVIVFLRFLLWLFQQQQQM